MRLSDMLGMSLLICPSLQTYTANIAIWRGEIIMYTSMFWITFACDSTYFQCGGDIGFDDGDMIYVS